MSSLSTARKLTAAARSDITGLRFIARSAILRRSSTFPPTGNSQLPSGRRGWLALCASAPNIFDRSKQTTITLGDRLVKGAMCKFVRRLVTINCLHVFALPVKHLPPAPRFLPSLQSRALSPYIFPSPQSPSSSFQSRALSPYIFPNPQPPAPLSLLNGHTSWQMCHIYRKKVEQTVYSVACEPHKWRVISRPLELAIVRSLLSRFAEPLQARFRRKSSAC